LSHPARLKALVQMFSDRYYGSDDGKWIAEMAKSRVGLDELFKGRHFERKIIVLCVRWYLRFKLNLRDLDGLIRAVCIQLGICDVRRPNLHLMPFDRSVARRSRIGIVRRKLSWLRRLFLREYIRNPGTSASPVLQPVDQQLVLGRARYAPVGHPTRFLRPATCLRRHARFCSKSYRVRNQTRR
jgi:hypothetical protein